MTQSIEPQVNWSQDKMIEVKLNEPDDFLKVRETLTRIGVASRKEKKLYRKQMHRILTLLRLLRKWMKQQEYQLNMEMYMT